jgi:TonB-linked SusC/RagA family outer membrane protein
MTASVEAVGNRTTINVELQPDIQAIEDVIVVAFGKTTKDAFTGSVKVVDGEELSKTQSSNVQNALVGKVAGVQFATPSGRLGTGQNIYVRGVGSISAGNTPLWVIDGAPYEGDINNINTADIESITVLKDAASNALYGARGANGVVMVTTKRAKAGEANVTFDGKWGVNTRALQTYDVVETAGEFYELHHKSLHNYFRLEQGQETDAAYISASNLLLTNKSGGVGYNVFTIPEGEALIGRNGRLNPNATEGRVVSYMGEDYMLKPDNWLDEVYKSATMRQEYNVNISGASDRANFYASLSYLDNTGIIDGSSMNRLTARLRAEYQVKKWMRMGANMSYAHFVWNNGNDGENEGASDGANVFAFALRMAPIYPIYIRNGEGLIKTDKWGMKLYDAGDGRNGGALRSNGGKSNPLQDIQLNKYISEGNAMTANGFTDIDLFQGLRLTVNGSVALDETRSTTMLNPYYGQFSVNGGIVGKGHSRDISYNAQQLLNYGRSFGLHNVDVLVGHEYYNRKTYGLSASKASMWSPDNLELNGSVVDREAAASSKTEYNNEGYMFRGLYNYDNKYFFSASYRRDASSKFLPLHRWGDFWSVGGAWILSREEWFAVPWVDRLKVKSSFGSQGNDAIPDFLYVDMYNIKNDGNDKPISVFARKGNPDITWETNANFNFGVEFDLWGGRLSGDVEFFNRKTSDMLFNLSVPLEAGFSSIYTNMGDMVNRGIEAELSTVLLRTRDLMWNFTINMTYLRNKLVKLPDQYNTTLSADERYTGRISGNYFLAEGMSRYTFYIPTYAGVNPENGKSQWYYYKKNEKTGETQRLITDQYSDAQSNGREMHGDSTPDLFGGFNTSFRWRGIDFSAGFTYQLGGQVLDSGYMFYMSSPAGTSTGNNYHRDLHNSWTPENTNTNIPRFAYNDANVGSTSDRFLIDASYLNIQNLTLGYTIPKSFTKKFFVENMRVYATCDNVWYWSKRQGLDPRQAIDGSTNLFYYAPIRTLSGGLNITF